MGHYAHQNLSRLLLINVAATTCVMASGASLIYYLYTRRTVSGGQKRKTQVDLHAPILRLPPEILAQVFEDSVSEYDTTAPQRYYASLKNLALVSRQWRAIVLSTPGLWRSLDDGSDTPSMTTALARSGRKSTLHLAASLDNIRNVPELLNSLDRWQIVRLNVDAKEERSHLPPELHRSAPKLEALYVDAFDEAQNWHLSPPAQLVNIFNNDAPNLRSIWLRCVSIPWTSSLFRNLHNLTLSGIVHQSPTLNNIINILCQCPDLWGLTLVAVRLEVEWDNLTFMTVEVGRGIRRLHLNVPDPIALALLLMIINAPSCCTLKACSPGHPDSGSIIARSGCVRHVATVLGNAIEEGKPLTIKCTSKTFSCYADHSRCCDRGHLLVFEIDYDSTPFLQRLAAEEPATLEKPHNTPIHLHIEDIHLTTSHIPRLSNVVSLSLINVSNVVETLGYLGTWRTLGDGLQIPYSELEDLTITITDEPLNANSNNEIVMAILSMFQSRDVLGAKPLRTSLVGINRPDLSSLPRTVAEQVMGLTRRSMLTWPHPEANKWSSLLVDPGNGA